MAFSKAEVRAEALAKRKAVSPEVRRAFAARLASLGPRLVLDYAPANGTLAVGLFNPIGSEPDLHPLMAALAAAGVPTALPVVDPSGGPLCFRHWVPGDPLESSFGVGEPADSAQAIDPDMLFVPLAAFDRRGHRIGYGKGHFDRTLGHLRTRKTIRAVGVAFGVQEVLFIPDEPHDQPLDFVVTDRDFLICET